jgi:hypothetical protein
LRGGQRETAVCHRTPSTTLVYGRSESFVNLVGRLTRASPGIAWL